ncbi:MAG TPA: protein O-GlcNAcase [Candidatus Limnocylindrales bacterium]|jgi:hyaluronoglucosaminidase
MTGLTPFRFRGVVEGFYGRPWTHAQRLDAIEFLGAHGMNTFVYAPKDDPFLRREWREPYTGTDLARIRELVGRSDALGIEFVYCLSPGLSITYASDNDVRALTAKFRSVAELGVRRFGLLLDDIPQDLQHDADRDRFADLAEAHVALIGRVYDDLPAGAALIVCPTVYWGYGDEAYVARLGRGIDPRIDLFWTGRAICSATLDLFDAATFARSTARLPTYWDNYPVNDVAMSHELHVGPYRGRDRHLYRFASGVIANGMELFESSKIAFATIADYLRSPEGYEPEASWQAALREVAGEPDWDAYALFADNVRSSCLSAEDAPQVTRALESFTFRFERGEASAAARELAALADRLLAAADHLLRGPVHNTALIAEGRPWIEAFEIGARAMRCMADLAASGRLAADGPSELFPYLERLREARVRVFGDALTMTLTDLTNPSTVNEGSQVRAGGGRS